MNTDILDDILDQPRLLTESTNTHLEPDSALDRAVIHTLQARPRRIILTGMGSSFFAAYPAFLRLLAAGFAVSWIELSELLHYGGDQHDPEILYVIISQSGETVEVVRLLEDHQPAGSIIAVTNGLESTLARRATIVLPTGAGPEQSVATKTYTTALLALTLFSERLAGATPRELAVTLADTLEAARQVCETAPAQIASLPEAWFAPGPLTLVGRGPSLASALSGALLLKETAKLPAEGMSSAQFRHGPLEIAGPQHRAIICGMGGPTLAFEQKLAAELRSYGSQTLFLGPIAAPDAHAIILPDVPHIPLLAIIPLQLLAREIAIRHGIVPGSFKHIGKVTATE